MSNLRSVRQSWEATGEVIATLDDGFALLVILRVNECFYCHRYFPLDGDRDGDAWDVSVDHSGVAAVDAMAWLASKASGAVSGKEES